MIPFSGNKDAKAVSSKFRYRRCCVSIIMWPVGYLISPHVAHDASWVWDPWSRTTYLDCFQQQIVDLHSQEPWKAESQFMSAENSGQHTLDLDQRRLVMKVILWYIMFVCWKFLSWEWGAHFQIIWRVNCSIIRATIPSLFLRLSLFFSTTS